MAYELLGSDWESVTSSVVNYRVENGRTYHAYKDGCRSLVHIGLPTQTLEPLTRLHRSLFVPERYR